MSNDHFRQHSLFCCETPDFGFFVCYGFNVLIKFQGCTVLNMPLDTNVSGMLWGRNRRFLLVAGKIINDIFLSTEVIPFFIFFPTRQTVYELG